MPSPNLRPNHRAWRPKVCVAVAQQVQVLQPVRAAQQAPHDGVRPVQPEAGGDEVVAPPRRQATQQWIDGGSLADEVTRLRALGVQCSEDRRRDGCRLGVGASQHPFGPAIDICVRRVAALGEERAGA